ncbi:hypothetical protein TTHERM_00222320 (macronuclear) [Tetrahymena thermophila SB210]|uniref:Uncharacterized protein n=1 Tax=Tetrahymena thermophila (strain SB210) TaxID=312017 RepID=Q23C53_TETTS|nr:hypothetical protein TTHERM_00222320 [Tetrahymena thermophila SB210]EAR93915.2 hypothetical protein TTHERM_00222320 [Tetrahymena thermophila SB210]|eukprot:XP_001014160.2 hypothetical protein TTHERM_00222320 [Tetrahymena thermophila SB210]
MSFNDIYSEQEYKQSTKTEEELKRLTLEEDLGETKRSFQILTKGQHLQKWAIYSRLHRILQEQDAFQILFPIISEDIQNQDEELQIEAANSLVKALEQKFLDQDQMKQIYNLTLIMLKIWSQPVLDSWVLVFRELLKILPYNLIEDETNKIILYLSDSSQPAVSRYISGRMIGFVADVRKDKIKGTLFERSRILCLDHDIEVRKIMAKEVIQKICKYIATDSIEMHLLDKILQLVYDSEINVKCAGIELIFNITQYLSAEEQKNRMCKIFMELLQSPKEEIQIQMSSMIGQIFNQLEQFLCKNQQNVQAIINTFKEYGSSKNVKLRINFAYNFPAVLHLTDSKTTFDKLKNNYINQILKDDSKEVRYKLISSFHEVTGLVTYEDLQKHLLPIFKELIKENDSAIILRLVQNIDVTIKNFIRPDTKKSDDQDDQQEEQKNNQEDAYMTILLQFYIDQEQRHSWRIKALFLEKLQNCLQLFNMNKFYKQFIPMVLENLRKDPNEVRYQAAGVLIKFICSNHYINKSKELITEMINNFFKSKSYQQRISFIYFVEQATQNFSRDYFKKSKLFCVLEFASDQIREVKMRLAKALPKIRYMLNEDDEESEDMVDKFEKTISQLQNKKDKELSLQMEKVMEEIDEIDFESEEVQKQIEKQDEDRKKNEERLIALELKEREENSKTNKDDYDLIYRSELSSNNFNHNYKKRYSARINMSPSITNQPGIKSKLSLQSHNTSSLTSLKINHSNSVITNTTTTTTSLYSSSSLKKDSGITTTTTTSSVTATTQVRKQLKRSSFEQKSSITTGSTTTTLPSLTKQLTTGTKVQTNNGSDFKSPTTLNSSGIPKGNSTATSTIKKKI